MSSSIQSPRASEIEQLITQHIHVAFDPVYFELHNDSHGHATASDASHFRVLIVSKKFVDASRVKQQQMVYQVLTDVMQCIHALAMQTYTPEQWETHPNNQSGARTPPPCAQAH